MDILIQIVEIVRYILIVFFGVIFFVNLILTFAKKNDDGFEVEVLTIGYMVVSLLAIITIKIL